MRGEFPQWGVVMVKSNKLSWTRVRTWDSNIPAHQHIALVASAVTLFRRLLPSSTMANYPK